jgi:DNA polymerase I-like protein with 3'-5' exonuclease and polymerase domains
MNSAIQGSAAEMIKTAMVNAYDEGIPLLITLYDELGASIESEAKAKQLADIFETAIKFEVPQICEWELRKNWGEKE